MVRQVGRHGPHVQFPSTLGVGSRMQPPYDFGISQEDERTEQAALGLPGGRVLSIASAGDMPLSLLALGAEQVTAVDISPGQIALGELKRASVLALAPGEAASFLGYRSARLTDREAWFDQVLPMLPESARAFWRQHRPAAVRGAIWAGRFERYLGVVRRLTSPLLRRRFARLCSANTLDAQAMVFDQSLDRAWLHAIFELAFHPGIFAGRGVDHRSLQHRTATQSVGTRYFERFRDMCMKTPARENHLLQLFTLGEVTGTDALPAYLTEAGATAVRARSSALEFRVASIFDALAEAPPGTFDRFHLSNLSDWLPPAELRRLLTLVVERADRPAKLVWRDLHRETALETTLVPSVREDREAGERLRLLDRFPFYAIHLAEITA